MDILFATDHSDASRNAAKLISRVPFAGTVNLRIVSVVSFPSLSESAQASSILSQQSEAEQNEAHTRNKELAKEFRDIDCDVTSVVRCGRFADEILAESESNRTDLVIVGAAGQLAAEQIARGSVADQVAIDGHCSTLVARNVQGVEPASKPIRALVASDGVESSRRVLHDMGRLAGRQETRFTLLRVLQPINARHDETVHSSGERREADRERFEQELMEAAAPFTSRGCEVTTELVVSTDVGNAICKHAENNAIDFIVLGERRGESGPQLPLGEVSRYVFRHAGTSVWICRSPGS